MSKSKRPVIIITDAKRGGDDVVAITVLLASVNISIIGIIATSGNVWTEDAYSTIVDLLRELGCQNIPVFRGEAASYHKRRKEIYNSNKDLTNFAGALDLHLGDQVLAPKDKAAEKFLEREATHYEGLLELVILSPATIVGDLISLNPSISSYINRVYFMGAAFNSPGNVNQYSEFNVWFNPESVRALFNSDCQITILPLDAIENRVYPDWLHRELSDTKSDVLSNKTKTAVRKHMWDEILAAVVVDDSASKLSYLTSADVNTNTGDANYFGKTFTKAEGRKNLEVISKIDFEKVTFLIRDSVRKFYYDN